MTYGVGQTIRYVPKAQRPAPTVTYIYALCDPRTDTVRYVGRAADPQERMRQHVLDPGCHSPAKREWRSELLNAGLCPYMVILEIVPVAEGNAAELSWIRHYLDHGCDLLNGVNYLNKARKL